MLRRTAGLLASQALFLLVVVSSLAAARSVPSGVTVDPFTDPKNDPFNPLHYIANNGLTAMAVGEYHIIATSVLGRV